ncbi:MAG: DUF4160 domain-containing protein [Dehalococcoidia bacterium]
MRQVVQKGAEVPRIAEFYGVVIYMYHREHGPPHFHAIYGEYAAEVGIDDIGILAGRLPPRAQTMVFEWAALHQRELRENWERARWHEILFKVEPLE